MSRNQSDVVLRLVAKDEGVRDALNNMGRDGKKALREIDRAAKKAKPGLKAVDGVVGDIKQSASGMLDRLGPAGTALRALGPVGVAAGAGLAATVGTLGLLSSAGQEAIMTLAGLSREADSLDIDAEQLQAARLQMERLGIATGQTDAALATAKKVLAEATLGTGELYTVLRQINPERAEEVRRTKNFADQLKIVSRAMSEAKSETEAHNIVVRTFGDGGAKAGREIIALEGGLDGTTASMKAQGLVIAKDLLPRYEEMAQEITAAEQKADVALLRLKSRFVELGVSSAQMKSGFADSFVAFTAQETDPVEDRIRNLKVRFEDKLVVLRALPGGYARVQRAVRDFHEELAELERQQARTVAANDAIAAQFEEGGTLFTPPSPAASGQGEITLTDSERSKAESEALRRQNEMNAARRSAAQVLAKLGDVTQLVAQREAELQQLVEKKLLTDAQAADAVRDYREQLEMQTTAARATAEAEKRAAEIRTALMSDQERITAQLTAREAELSDLRGRGLLSDRQAAAALSQYSDELRGVADAKEELAGLLLDTLDPMERLARDLERLEELQVRANLPAAEFNRILAERNRVANEAVERDLYGETLDDAEARIREAAMSAEDVIQAKVDAERQVLEALADRLPDLDADDYLKKYEEGLRSATEQGKEFAGAQDLIRDALQGNIASFEDLGDVALKILSDIILKAFETSESLGGIGGGGGGFGGLLGSVFASVFHDGTSDAGRPKRQRRLSANSRLAPDERLTVTRSGERVFTESDNRDLINAINAISNSTMGANDNGPAGYRRYAPPAPMVARNPLETAGLARAVQQAYAGARQGGGGQVVINLHNSAPGTEVRQTERERADGSREVDLRIEQIVTRSVSEGFEQGSFDNQMQRIYGVTRQPGVR